MLVLVCVEFIGFKAAFYFGSSLCFLVNVRDIIFFHMVMVFPSSTLYADLKSNGIINSTAYLDDFLPFGVGLVWLISLFYWDNNCFFRRWSFLIWKFNSDLSYVEFNLFCWVYGFEESFAFLELHLMLGYTSVFVCFATLWSWLMGSSNSNLILLFHRCNLWFFVLWLASPAGNFRVWISFILSPLLTVIMFLVFFHDLN